MADIFARWNQGQLDSFLIDITKDILRFKDASSGDALVTKIRDAAGQKVKNSCSKSLQNERNVICLAFFHFIILMLRLLHRARESGR